MNYQELRQTVEQYMETNWTTIPMVYENVPALIEEEYWSRLTVMPIDAKNSTIGTGRVKIKGLIILQLFAPLDVGTGRIYELADEVNTLLSNMRFGDLFLYAGKIEPIGQSPTTSFNPGGSGQFRELTPGFFQINVKIPFEAN